MNSFRVTIFRSCERREWTDHHSLALAATFERTRLSILYHAG